MYNRIARKWLLSVALFALIAFIAIACAPAPAAPPQPQVIEKIVQVTPTAKPPTVPRVALIMSGKRADQSWNQFMADDVQKLVAKGTIKATFAEDVNPPDFERVAGDYASQKYDLIIAHTSDFTEAALKVAKQYPEVKFAVTGATQFLPNLAGLNNWTHQSSAEAGYLAAYLTKSKKVGIIGAFAFPTQFVAHEGFKYGVFRANQEFVRADRNAKQVTCIETFTNTWFDTALGFEAAKAHMDQGADYIYITASGAGFGVVKAAEQQKKARVIGSFVDLNAFSPDVIITSVERLAAIPLEAVLDDIKTGKFVGRDYAFDLRNGGTQLSPFHKFDSEIPADVKAKVKAFHDNIINGVVIVPFVTAKMGGETVCEAPVPKAQN